MLKQLIIASLAIVSFAATSAQAQEARSVRISVAGLDTQSESGARVILQRIKFAAGTVCGPAPRYLERSKQYNPCVREVTQRTVAGLSNPRLTAILTQDGRSPLPAKLASAK
jgi:UrcA family protein